ncbi:MAG: FliA/WhiG family RNA polymerase sigma factor [Polyangiales bacterium]
MLTTAPLLRTPSSLEVTRHMPLVKQVVARFLRRLPANVLRDDLVAAGVFGLIDSLRKNGGDSGASFESYARIRIRGAILDELRAQDWLPRRARWAASGKTPSTGDGPTAVVGLDDLSPQEHTAHFVDEDQESAVAMLEKAHEARQLSEAIDRLPPRERTIVRMHYFAGARFKEIGETLGVSEPRISQLHSRAMGQLRKLLATTSLAA